MGVTSRSTERAGFANAHTSLTSLKAILNCFARHSPKIGFTLAEMMVVMLILSIILAAFAPVMTTRSKSDRTSPWRYASDNTNIYYGLGDNQTAMIGQPAKVNGTDPSARLIINTSDDNQKHIAFKRGADNLLGYLYMSSNSIVLGNGSTSGSNNLAFGNDALKSNTTGYGNFAGGTNSLISNKSGSYNIALGFNTLYNTNSNYNIGIGSQTLYKNTGYDNVAIGHETMFYNTSGNDNTAVGVNALNASLGSENAALGFKTLKNVTTSYNTAIGAYANSDLTNGGSYTTAIGYKSQALASYATAVGYNSEASGSSSTALGYYTKVTGSSSIAAGNSSKAEGSWATAYGYASKALKSETVAIGDVAEASEYAAVAMGYNSKAQGSNSVSIGYNSKAANTNSVALGYSAASSGDNAIAIGKEAQARNSNNIAIGASACRYATGANKICIGNNSGPGSGSTFSSDAYERVFIGGQSKFNGGAAVLEVHNTGKRVSTHSYAYSGNDSTVVINGNLIVKGTIISHIVDRYGNYASDFRVLERSKEGEENASLKGGLVETSGFSDYFVNGTGWWRNSDRRLKYVGKEFTSGLDKIRALKVYNYTFKKDKSQEPRVGVMAQDLQKIFPNAVTKGEKGYLQIRMEDMFYALINAVKELDVKVTTLIKEVKILQEQNKNIEARLRALEASKK